MTFSAYSFLTPLSAINSFIVISPEVIVPVLSKHITSTRAKVSIQYNCCTKTLNLASLATLTAITELVSKRRPSGIIPIKAPTVLKIALVTL